MNTKDFEKLITIRKLLKEAYDHYFQHSDGHCKISEGHISLSFGDYWSDKNCECNIILTNCAAFYGMQTG